MSRPYLDMASWTDAPCWVFALLAVAGVRGMRFKNEGRCSCGARLRGFRMWGVPSELDLYLSLLHFRQSSNSPLFAYTCHRLDIPQIIFFYSAFSSYKQHYKHCVI